MLKSDTEQDGEHLRYIGRVGTGYNMRTRQALGALIENTHTAMPLLEEGVKPPPGAQFLRQAFSAEVVIGGWTKDRQLRQARFLGVQSDRAAPLFAHPRRVAKNKPKNPPKEASDWSVTHPERVLFPQDGITKGDIARYYESMQQRILPHLDLRPVSLLRAPESIDKELFFQRHPLTGMKLGIEAFEPFPGEYFALNGSAGLHTAVQFGAIELHGWNTKTNDLTHPDRVMFDLEPDEGLPFSAVKTAAVKLRDYLAAAGLKSWPMLSGGKGIHIIIPLDGQADTNEVALFSGAMAKGIAGERPDMFVATMSKAKRQGRIFIDWLRNRSKATAIIPWSVRARPGAPVAAPVLWRSLHRFEIANAFTIKNATDAVDWKDSFNSPQAIDKRLLKYLGANLPQR